MATQYSTIYMIHNYSVDNDVSFYFFHFKINYKAEYLNVVVIHITIYIIPNDSINSISDKIIATSFIIHF